MEGTSSGQKKTRFLPGTSRLLPSCNVGGEIKGGQWSIACNSYFLVYD